MRKIEQQMNMAIRGGVDMFKGNTSVQHYISDTGDKEAVVHLHGNHIATVGKDFLRIFDGGWQTVTTKSRLNALCNGFAHPYIDGVFQQNFCWFINTKNGVVDFVNGYEFRGAKAEGYYGN